MQMTCFCLHPVLPVSMLDRCKQFGLSHDYFLMPRVLCVLNTMILQNDMYWLSMMRRWVPNCNGQIGWSTSGIPLFPPLYILFEYWIEHVSFGLLYVMFTFPTRIFYRGVPGFATDCPCGVWCRWLTTCPLYVCPLFGNLVQNDS